jgi:hypothetical protein
MWMIDLLQNLATHQRDYLKDLAIHKLEELLKQLLAMTLQSETHWLSTYLSIVLQ